MINTSGKQRKHQQKSAFPLYKKAKEVVSSKQVTLQRYGLSFLYISFSFCFFFFFDSVITKIIEQLDLRSFYLFSSFSWSAVAAAVPSPPLPSRKKKKTDHCKKFPPLKKCGCVIGFLQEDFLLASHKRLFIGIWQKSKRMNGEKKKEK